MGTIEAEIIPRLLLASDEAAGAPAGPVRDAAVWEQSWSKVDPAEVAEFAGLLIRHEIEVAAQYVQVVKSRGVAPETLLLELFAPAARELGDMWLRDDCSFADVTIGLCSLERLLIREESAQESLDPVPQNEVSHDRLALFSPMPGEQHVFGLLIVKQLFRQAGWRVQGDSLSRADQIVRTLERKWFTIAGLSVSCDEDLSECANLIRAMRVASCNPNVYLVVGGRAFHSGAEELKFVGADAIASDGKEALAWAEQRVSRLAAGGRM